MRSCTGSASSLQRLAQPSGARPSGMGSVHSSPSYSSGPSRARARRTISTYSRVRRRGRPKGTPYQPSDTCGTRDPEPEAHASVAEHVQGDGRHRRGRGRASRNLHQAGAQRHALGLAGEQAEESHGLLSPGLGHPHRVQPQLVGQHRQLDLLLRGEPGPVGEEDADAHRADRTTIPRAVDLTLSPEEEAFRDELRALAGGQPPGPRARGRRGGLRLPPRLAAHALRGAAGPASPGRASTAGAAPRSSSRRSSTRRSRAPGPRSWPTCWAWPWAARR